MLNITALTAITVVLTTTPVVHLVNMGLQLFRCFEFRLRGRLLLHKWSTYPCINLCLKLKMAADLQLKIGFCMLSRGK